MTLRCSYSMFQAMLSLLCLPLSSYSALRKVSYVGKTQIRSGSFFKAKDS